MGWLGRMLVSVFVISDTYRPSVLYRIVLPPRELVTVILRVARLAMRSSYMFHVKRAGSLLGRG